MNYSSFSNPQWRVRKLQRFLFRTFSHRKTPDECEMLQSFFFWQGKVERRLQDLYFNNKEDFYEIFNDSILKKLNYIDIESFEDAVEKRINDNVYKFKSFLTFHKDINTPFTQQYAHGYNKLQDKGHNYINTVQFLANYLFDNELDFRELYGSFNADIDFNIDYTPDCKCDFDFDDERFMKIEINGVKFEVSCDESHRASYPKGNNLLKSDCIRKNNKAPVFILNSYSQAHELHVRYALSYYKKLAGETIKNIKSFNLVDGIARAKILNELQESQKRSDRLSLKGNYNVKCMINWTSFYGGGAALPYYNWNVLRNRDVYIVYHQREPIENVMPKFLQIYALFFACDIQTRDLQFIHVPEITDPLNFKNTNITVLSPRELLLEAFKKDINCHKELQKMQSEIVAKELKKKSSNDYIIYPVIRKKSLTVLTAPAKHGKSHFAMALSFAASRNGQLFSDWKVKEKAKVLYIYDREIDSTEIEKRKSLYNRIFKQRKSDYCVEFEPVCLFNLYEPQYREEIEEMLQQAQMNFHPKGQQVRLLVLDHLTKMTRGSLTAQLWDKLRPWFDHLMNDLGTAVLLLHHTNKSGETYGTSFIINDANIHMNLDKQESKGSLKFNVTVPAHRHAPEIDDPIEVTINMGEKPNIEPCPETKDKSLWKQIGNEDGRIQKFIEFKRDNPKIKMREIADKFGIGLKSVEGLAVRNGLTCGLWKDYHKTSNKKQDGH